MPRDDNGWRIFDGGDLARCPAPARDARYAGQPCDKWFADVGPGLRYRVRIHPLAGREDSPKPTAPNRSVHRCTKCHTHVEYEVIPAAAVA